MVAVALRASVEFDGQLRTEGHSSLALMDALLPVSVLVMWICLPQAAWNSAQTERARSGGDARDGQSAATSALSGTTPKPQAPSVPGASAKAAGPQTCRPG